MQDVRKSSFSGSWYPGDKDVLMKAIEGYFRQVDLPEISGDVIGLISPHAGYMFSGQVAAYGYSLIRGMDFDTVFVISPLHQLWGGKIVVNTANSYETPLGRVPVDRALIETLAKEIEIDAVQNDQEHAVEIQLPFLQSALESFKLIPLMMGQADVGEVEDIVTALIHTIEGRKALFIASSDLHHISDYEAVKQKDKIVVDALSAFDTMGIRNVLSQPDCSVCGRVPISLVIGVTKKMGAERLLILNQTNSGEITGEKSAGQYTVGYLSAAIVKN